MLDEEWSMFLNETTLSSNKSSLSLSPSSLTPNQCSDFDMSSVTPLYISTKTKIAYLNKHIDLVSIFWKLKIIPYSQPSEGLIKKQMKFNSLSKEAFEIFNESIRNEKGVPVVQQIIANISSDCGRIKFKDVRKVSVGFCSKDALNKSNTKSAFYNCFVIILRLSVQPSTFKEYHVKVFNTGKMEIPGIQKEEEFQQVLKSILKVLRQYDSEVEIENQTDTILINSNFKTGFYINRDNLYELLQKEYHLQCVYDPCSYPGIQCKFYYYQDREVQTGIQKNEDIKGKGYGYKKKDLNATTTIIKNKMLTRKNAKFSEVSIMLFRTGSILIVGMCSEDILYTIYEFLKVIMQKEYHRIRQTNVEYSLVTTSKKKNKKYIITMK